MSIVIGIEPDHFAGTQYTAQKWGDWFRAHGVEVKELHLFGMDALEQAKECDGVMWRWEHSPSAKQSTQRILYTIEHYLNIPVFPDSRTAWHYDEKIHQFYMMKVLGAPAVPTWLFWDAEEAKEWARNAKYPVVFKLSTGASSYNVVKVENQEKALHLIDRMFGPGVWPYTFHELEYHFKPPRTREEWKNFLLRLRHSLGVTKRYLLYNQYPPLPPQFWRPEFGYAFFQEFLPNNEYDTRISVVGNRAWGFRRWNRPGDFRASGSGRIDYAYDQVDPRTIEIAFDLSERGQFQSMAYDFLYKDHDPYICEISYTYVNYAIYNAPGYWDRNLNWIEGHLWPEEAQAEDFLALIMKRKAERSIAQP